ncbi:MAG: hypothetical protein CL981_05870 [Euryarchaeota archaeon]|jgi:L-lactate permease|nr:hypothetical protein [Euryarchaeota archaeon]MBD19349.1 hypothetical protein [Euryarchaeota archaeon]
MPGSPYIDEVEGLLDWRHILSTLCLVTIPFTVLGWYLGGSIGTITGGVIALIVLWTLKQVIGGKPLRPSPDHHDV